MSKPYAIFRILRSEYAQPAPGLVTITMVRVWGYSVQAPTAADALARAKRMLPRLNLQLCVEEIQND